MFTLIAQITNPVLPVTYGDAGVKSLENYIVLLWRALILVGALSAVLFLLWGAIDWIMAGGEEGKITAARQKMTGAIVGLIILSASVAIITLIEGLLGISILKLEFPTADPAAVQVVIPPGGSLGGSGRPGGNLTPNDP